jgi:hypothetical protein
MARNQIMEALQMSRFAVVYEDPDYDDAYAELEILEWLNNEIDGATVVKKPQEQEPYDLPCTD